MSKTTCLGFVIADALVAHVPMVKERYELLDAMSLFEEEKSFLFSRYEHDTKSVDDALHWLDETLTDILAQCWRNSGKVFVVHGEVLKWKSYQDALDHIMDLRAHEYQARSAGEAYERLWDYVYCFCKADARFHSPGTFLSFTEKGEAVKDE